MNEGEAGSEDLGDPEVLRAKLEAFDAELRAKLAKMGMTPEEIASVTDPSGTPEERAARRERAISDSMMRELARPDVMSKVLAHVERRIAEDPSLVERAVLSIEADELEEQLQRGAHIRRAVFAAVSFLLALGGALVLMFAVKTGTVGMVALPSVLFWVGVSGAFLLLRRGWPHEWVTRRPNPVPRRLWLPVFAVALAVGVPLVLWPTGFFGKASAAWRAQRSACRDLLTEKDIADLGGPQLRIQQVSDGGNTCKLHGEPTTPGGPRLFVAIRGDESEGIFRQNAELRLGGKLQPIPDVTDEAYRMTTSLGYGLAYRRGGASVTVFFPKADFPEDVVDRALPVLRSHDAVIDDYLTDTNRRGR